MNESVQTLELKSERKKESPIGITHNIWERRENPSTQPTHFLFISSPPFESAELGLEKVERK